MTGSEKYTRDFTNFVIALKQDKRLKLSWADVAGLFSVDDEPVGKRALQEQASRHRRGLAKYSFERRSQEDKLISQFKASGASDGAVAKRMGFSSRTVVSSRRHNAKLRREREDARRGGSNGEAGF